jgi:hypothetical protein
MEIPTENALPQARSSPKRVEKVQHRRKTEHYLAGKVGRGVGRGPGLSFSIM